VARPRQDQDHSSQDQDQDLSSQDQDQDRGSQDPDQDQDQNARTSGEHVLSSSLLSTSSCLSQKLLIKISSSLSPCLCQKLI